jgi:NADPH-dependent curcumin reductase CurA
MASTIPNKQILYVNTPSPAIDPDLSNGTFALRSSTIALPIPADNVLVRTHYISLDPAMRQWLTAKRSYIAPVELGDVMRGQAVAQVVQVGDNLKGHFKTGEWLIAGTGWQEYMLISGKEAAKQRAVVPPGCSPTDAMSVLGTVGLTAYFGLLEVGKLRKGDTVVVSGAAGATGMIVGQIAKIKGAKRVVGLAGTPDKCRFLTEELGFDVAINYKDADWKKQLRKACPDYIDVYFDNVGGEILDACLALGAKDARFAISGHISQYSAAKPEGPRNIMMLIVSFFLSFFVFVFACLHKQGQRITMKGFIYFDYHKQFPSALNDLRQWLVEGKIKRKEYIIKGGLEACPQGLIDLYAGANTGKTMVEVAPFSEALPIKREAAL